MSILGRGASMFHSTTAIPVFEGYSAESNGDIIAITESYEDQLKIMRSLHSIDKESSYYVQDIKALRESGADNFELEEKTREFETVMESAVSNAWEKIKKFFTNLFGKIKAFFASIMRHLSSVFMSAENFAKKYEPEVNKLDLIGFEYKIHEYSVDGPIPIGKMDIDGQVMAAIDGAITPAGMDVAILKEWEDDKEKAIDKLRASVLGESGEMDEDDFKTKIYAMWRNGAEPGEAPDERKVDIRKMLSELKGSTKLATNVKKFETDITSGFNKIISKIENAEKKVAGAKEKDGTYNVNAGEHKDVKMDNDKHSNALKYLQMCTSVTTENKSLALQMFKAWKTAFEERNSAYKSCILAAFRYKRDK